MLFKAKKFRGKGNKEGALHAMRNLQDGLGQLKEKEHMSKTDKTNKSSIKVIFSDLCTDKSAKCHSQVICTCTKAPPSIVVMVCV